MSRRTFLATGATGDTGGATAEQMLARGHPVRALAHRQDDRAKRLPGLGAEVGGAHLIPVAVARDMRQAAPVYGTYAGTSDALVGMAVEILVTSTAAPVQRQASEQS